jgi:hypothetical protein
VNAWRWSFLCGKKALLQSGGTVPLSSTQKAKGKAKGKFKAYK